MDRGMDSLIAIGLEVELVFLSELGFFVRIPIDIFALFTH